MNELAQTTSNLIQYPIIEAWWTNIRTAGNMALATVLVIGLCLGVHLARQRRLTLRRGGLLAIGTIAVAIASDIAVYSVLYATSQPPLPTSNSIYAITTSRTDKEYLYIDDQWYEVDEHRHRTAYLVAYPIKEVQLPEEILEHYEDHRIRDKKLEKVKTDKTYDLYRTRGKEYRVYHQWPRAKSAAKEKDSDIELVGQSTEGTS